MSQDFDALHHHESDLYLYALELLNDIVGAILVEYASICFSTCCMYQSHEIEYFGLQEFMGTTIGVGTTKCYQCYLDNVFVSFLHHAWYSKQAEDRSSVICVHSIAAMTTSDCQRNSLYYCSCE